VAAHLYSLAGRPELALAIYLRLHQPVSSTAERASSRPLCLRLHCSKAALAEGTSI